MRHEDGYCDGCGAEAPELWLTMDGLELCRGCAVDEESTAVRVATKPEARDDGR
jgi:hypothetical protein